MARITVEDCISRLPDRFQLVMLAAERVRQMNAGAAPTLPRERDKSTILALREIAAGTVTPARLRESWILRRQRFLADEAADDEADAGGRFEAAVASSGGKAHKVPAEPAFEDGIAGGAELRREPALNG